MFSVWGSPMLCGGCHLRLANLGSSRSAVRWGTCASLTSLGLHNSASDCLRLARIHSPNWPHQQMFAFYGLYRVTTKLCYNFRALFLIYSTRIYVHYPGISCSFRLIYKKNCDYCVIDVNCGCPISVKVIALYELGNHHQRFIICWKTGKS